MKMSLFDENVTIYFLSQFAHFFCQIFDNSQVCLANPAWYEIELGLRAVQTPQNILNFPQSFET